MLQQHRQSMIMKHGKNIEFGALKIFASVAESETLSQAAEQLGVTQSAVSQAIKQLEEHCSTELVIRRSRPIKLTPSGQVLKDYATKILADSQRMLADVRMASTGAALPLSVGMIDSFGDVSALHFMQRIKPFTSKLALRTGLVTPLTEALLNRDLDLLITSDPIEDHPELKRYPILRDPFVMIVPEKYYQEGKVTPQWLATNVPFVHYNRLNRIGVLTDLIARRLDIELMTHYELDSTQTLLRFVQAGYGWAIVTGLCLVRYPELLQGTRIMQLAKGANARYVSLLCRSNELGDLPQKITQICREIFDSELAPQLTKLADWLDQDAYTITELPII
jgi:DNA-binding transcriptional LysR family regulator